MKAKELKIGMEVAYNVGCYRDGSIGPAQRAFVVAEPGTFAKIKHYSNWTHRFALVHGKGPKNTVAVAIQRRFGSQPPCWNPDVVSVARIYGTWSKYLEDKEADNRRTLELARKKENREELHRDTICAMQMGATCALGRDIDITSIYKPGGREPGVVRIAENDLKELIALAVQAKEVK